MNNKTAEEIQNEIFFDGPEWEIGNVEERLTQCMQAWSDQENEVLKKRIEELEAMVILKLDRPEHSKIVLTNKRGDTFTSRSEELIDFLHDYPSTNGKQD